MRPTPSKDLKEKIAQTLPLLKEARAHNNRSLLNDLSDALMKDLDHAIGRGSNNTDTKLYRAVRRQIKAMLLQSAYVEPEGLSLPRGEEEEIPGGQRKGLSDYIEENRERRGIDVEDVGLPTEDEERAARVNCRNTQRFGTPDISLMLRSTREEKTTSSDHLEEGAPEKYGNSENFEVDISACLVPEPSPKCGAVLFGLSGSIPTL